MVLHVTWVTSLFHFLQIHWVWEYKQTRDVTWSAYTDTSDIVTSSSVPGSSQPNVCYKRQTSTLTRRLTLEDDNRESRCYVRRDNRDYTEYAETLQVGAVDVPGDHVHLFKFSNSEVKLLLLPLNAPIHYRIQS